MTTKQINQEEQKIVTLAELIEQEKPDLVFGVFGSVPSESGGRDRLTSHGYGFHRVDDSGHGRYEIDVARDTRTILAQFGVECQTESFGEHKSLVPVLDIEPVNGPKYDRILPVYFVANLDCAFGIPGNGAYDMTVKYISRTVRNLRHVIDDKFGSTEVLMPTIVSSMHNESSCRKYLEEGMKYILEQGLDKKIRIVGV